MTQWYLGVDVGTTGISAALLQRETQKVYPIYWQAEQTELSARENLPFTFRLPVSVYYLDSPQQTPPHLVSQFKPLLNLGIPYHQSVDSPELIGIPRIQWSEQQSLPLGGFRDAWTALLSTLHPGRGLSGRGLSSVRPQNPIIALPNLYALGAVGLDAVEFQQALNGLEGVILGCPTAATEAYRFNLREAVLAAGIVKRPEQIFIIEDAIATLLYQFHLHPPDPDSTILIINIGATTTEMAVAQLPQNLTEFTASQVVCHHLAYAGDALNQDIMTQLLIRSENSPFPEFDLRDSDIPQPGYPDLVKRYRLQQILHGNQCGIKLLEIAETLKFELQQQDIRLNRDSLGEVSPKDLEQKIFVPFIQQLNQELNHFFSEQGISPIRITQAICTGGNGTWPTLSRWLRQKLPNALITQDSPHDQYNSDNNYSHCSRLAWGLAVLPLYFQVLDVSRHQYSDYFLLAELLRVFKEQPLSLSEVYQLLENRGVNTRSVSNRILAILNGKLPSGLIPSPADAIWLTVESQNNPDYQELLEGSLFYQDVDQNYFISLDRADMTRKYLAQLSLNSLQNWEEPLISYQSSVTSYQFKS